MQGMEFLSVSQTSCLWGKKKKLGLFLFGTNIRQKSKNVVGKYVTEIQSYHKNKHLFVVTEAAATTV